MNRGPGWAFGFGASILTDPAAAQTPQSPGTFGWGGVWGHTWFVDPVRRLSVVSLTNTALEGMMGRYVRDPAIYAGSSDLERRRCPLTLPCGEGRAKRAGWGSL